MKQLLLILIIFVGEILVISANVIFGDFLPTRFLILNCIISALVLLLFCTPFFLKYDFSGDKVGRWVGTISFHSTGIFLFCLAAVAAIILMNSSLVWVIKIHETDDTYYYVAFGYQILVHLALFFGLLLMLGMGQAVGDQVEQVYAKEQIKVSNRREMLSAVRRIQDQLFVSEGVNPEVRMQVEHIAEELRFIAPCDTEEAMELENEFVVTANTVASLFRNYQGNVENIDRQLKLLSRNLQNRKNVKH